MILGILVVGVFIGVILQCKLSVCLLYFILVSRTTYTKNLVVIFFIVTSANFESIGRQ